MQGRELIILSLGCLLIHYQKIKINIRTVTIIKYFNFLNKLTNSLNNYKKKRS